MLHKPLCFLSVIHIFLSANQIASICLSEQAYAPFFDLGRTVLCFLTHGHAFLNFVNINQCKFPSRRHKNMELPKHVLAASCTNRIASGAVALLFSLAFLIGIGIPIETCHTPTSYPICFYVFSQLASFFPLYALFFHYPILVHQCLHIILC
jgi:hypothetical protein